MVTGRDHDRGATVVDEITAAGGSAVFVPSDLAGGPDTLREFAAAAQRALDGRVDVLVHNAGVVPATATPDLPDADLDTALAVNVRAPHVLTAALAPAMAGRGEGAVVTIGSWMATVGSPFAALYSATKAAEEQLTRCWAAEFGPRGVRVNTVSPGATRTPVNQDAGAAMDAMAAAVPAGRTGTPDDIARAVVWLASAEPAFVHGATLRVDGGMVATRLW